MPRRVCRGPDLPDPNSSGGAPLPLGTAAWLLPVRLEGSDFSAIPQKDLNLIRSYFDEVFRLLLLRPHTHVILQGIGGIFAPLLKDLVRFCSTTLEEGDPALATYRGVATSASFLEATREWEAARPLRPPSRTPSSGVSTRRTGASELRAHRWPGLSEA